MVVVVVEVVMVVVIVMVIIIMVHCWFVSRSSRRVGPSGHKPVVEFLQSTDQFHTVESVSVGGCEWVWPSSLLPSIHQCDQLKEFIGFLHWRRMIMSTAL